MATPDGTGAINYAVRRPVGVIGVICPWNLPLLLMTWKVGAGAGLRQHRRRQAVGGDAADRDAARRGDERGRRAEGRLQRRARLRAGLGRRIPDPPSGRRRHHLHRRDAHRRGDHEGGGRRRAAGVAGNGRQESRHRLRRLRLRRGHRRHHALLLRQLRPGVPGHRAHLCRAADVRQVRRRAEGRARREAQDRRVPRTTRPAWAR